jgi:hypothetical protein
MSTRKKKNGRPSKFEKINQKRFKTLGRSIIKQGFIGREGLEEFLNLRIATFGNDSEKGRCGRECLLKRHIDNFLPMLLNSMGLNYQNIAKEFHAHRGFPVRMDYVIKLDSGDFIIIEVKASSDEMDCARGIGQLLAYREILAASYDIAINRFKMFLFTNKDSLVAYNVIKSSNLPIELFTIGKEGIKCYGQTQRELV